MRGASRRDNLQAAWYLELLMLPPTSANLREPGTRPYFLWWLDCTVEQFIEHLQSPDPKERAYYLGALLREANSRDVWVFTTPEEVRRCWPTLVRHLGRSRARWAWLLDIERDDVAGQQRLEC